MLSAQLQRSRPRGIGADRQPDPAAATRITSERGPAPWLGSLTDGELAELTGAATDLVAKFIEGFPPLKREWWPVTETRLHVQLFDGALVLSGACDLLLGRPDPVIPRRVTARRRREPDDGPESTRRGSPP